MLVHLLCIASTAFASSVAAQTTFADVTPAANPYFTTPEDADFWVNAVAPADVDGDGRIDLAVLGFHVVYNASVEDKLVILHNDGEGADGRWNFSATEIPPGDIVAGASDLAWGDVDGDGDVDLAVASEGVTALLRNDAGSLVRVAAPLPGYFEDSSYESAYDLRSLTWVDFDNDGDQDLLIPSTYDAETFSWRTALMRNDGSDGNGGRVFTDVGAAIDPTVHAQSAWSDHDGDGDLDLFLANVDPYTETGFVRLYRNDAGAFSASDPLAIRVEHGLADAADVDADGDQDILVAGNIQEADGSFTTVLRIYANDAGAYTPETLVQAPGSDWLDIHAATWADYDSDGDVDVLVTGSFVGATKIEGRSEIYANDAGTFTALGANLPAPIGSIGRGGTFTWFDLDGDGDLDCLVAGAFFVPGGNGLVESRMHVLRNLAQAGNMPPAMPAGLLASPAGDGVMLSWSAPADDHTPPSQLGYDLELRRDGDLVPAPTRLPQPGALNAATHWTMTNLPPGSYSWRVRAVDTAYAGSAPAHGAFVLPFAADPIFGDGFDA
ncbi:fibronectin type III domain-containing protein [Dokdonella sp.]|uniref:fibronectin type III domain-containing protein n=1 Tax=Dokdonella sp. TaxID=2291710 RepID=UPI002F41C005